MFDHVVEAAMLNFFFSPAMDSLLYGGPCFNIVPVIAPGGKVSSDA